MVWRRSRNWKEVDYESRGTKSEIRENSKNAGVLVAIREDSK